ncbi:hypothetical protein BK816_01205 [Boudabousia tangfeifanii]|uniref:Uncharacterized protein n=1 Tax=Boudabousia tangfeifanii TaxID=1912795 RepID=A0A1D9MIC9_9ACTO|nr:hypothetical protein BK816_01205 [Boudabousia tangfeifanii]
MGITILSVIAAEFLIVTIRQPYTRKVRHNDPGGWLMVFVELLATLLVYSLVAIALVGVTKTAWIVLGCAMAVRLASQIMTKSWEPGWTRAAFKETWEETKKMTQELANED